jgi:hypothetical protein
MWLQAKYYPQNSWQLCSQATSRLALMLNLKIQSKLNNNKAHTKKKKENLEEE